MNSRNCVKTVGIPFSLRRFVQIREFLFSEMAKNYLRKNPNPRFYAIAGFAIANSFVQGQAKGISLL